jgi:hypothetical protein
MTKCTQTSFEFPACLRRKVAANFNGGDVSSDGGVLLLRQVDQRLGLTKQLATVVPDPRNPDLITHPHVALLKQRIYGIACGYEDLNDHTTLRHDPGFQTAVERDEVLASASTLCRVDNRAYRRVAFDIHRVFVEQFIASFKKAPKELILDFDATDALVHGQQEGRFFHGYYGNYCFLPLYVFCGDQLLVSYLRRSNQDAAKHAWAILSLLVNRLRQAFPDVSIIFRGDSGFCRHRLLRWCERHDVAYIVGIARNNNLIKQSSSLMEQAEEAHKKEQAKQRLFNTFYYAAGTWNKKRRVIVKAEHTDKGANPRFVVTNLSGNSQTLYDRMYCARGNMENRIKEQQLGLFADRTSCHDWWANQFRLLLSSAAYILLEAIRRIGLKNTVLEKAQATTIRLKLFKIGAVIIRNTRRVKFLLSSAYPNQVLFFQVAEKLCPG